MKKLLFLILIIPFLILASCNNSGKGNGSENDTLKVSVATFADKADSLVDKMVLIEGTVLHTCKHGGKRLFLVDNNNDSVTVEVTAGGEISKFDEALIGSRIRVAGYLREERIDQKYLNEWEAEVLKPEENHQAGIHTGVKGHEDQDKQAKLDQINAIREELKSSGKDHLSNFSIEAIKYQELK